MPQPNETILVRNETTHCPTKRRCCPTRQRQRKHTGETLSKLQGFNGRLKKVRRDQKSRQHKVRASGRQCEAHRELLSARAECRTSEWLVEVRGQVNSSKISLVVQHVLPKADLSPFWFSSTHFRVSELGMHAQTFTVHIWRDCSEQISCLFRTSVRNTS